MCESAQNKDFGKRPLSFVRRSSRLDARLQKAWDSHRGAYLLDLPDSGHTLGVDPSFRFDCEYVRKIWGSDNPLVVEIGTGQGENIVAPQLCCATNLPYFFTWSYMVFRHGLINSFQRG